MEEFKRKCNELEDEIRLLKGENDNIEPISDGIVNIEKYLGAKYKILWILKESNDVRDNKGGGWSLNSAINELKCWDDQPQTGRITFQRIVYATYGLLNNSILWKDMPSVSNADVFESIKKISYINIKKIPGSTVSNPKVLALAYNENRDLLLRQISLYNPDIIITGNTLQYFFNDLSIPFDRKISNGKTAYYPADNRLYIHAYHPSVRGTTIKEEEYCNDIILAGKDWIENWKK